MAENDVKNTFSKKKTKLSYHYIYKKNVPLHVGSDIVNDTFFIKEIR